MQILYYSVQEFSERLNNSSIKKYSVDYLLPSTLWTPHLKILTCFCQFQTIIPRSFTQPHLESKFLHFFVTRILGICHEALKRHYSSLLYSKSFFLFKWSLKNYLGNTEGWNKETLSWLFKKQACVGTVCLSLLF